MVPSRASLDLHASTICASSLHLSSMSPIFLSSGFLLRRHCFPFFLSFFLSFYIGVLILVWAASRQVVCMSPHAGGRRTYKLWSFMLSSDFFGICSMMCCVSIYPCLQRDVEPYPRGASLHLAYLRSRSLNPCERPTSMGACFRGHSRQCSGVCTSTVRVTSWVSISHFTPIWETTGVCARQDSE